VPPVTLAVKVTDAPVQTVEAAGAIATEVGAVTTVTSAVVAVPVNVLPVISVTVNVKVPDAVGVIKRLVVSVNP
jgi:hypothetical protein